MMFTVLGSGGFIGGQLVDALEAIDRAAVYAPLPKDGADISDEIFDRDLGHVFYCIGLTADFRSRPLDTVKAHVCLLRRLLDRGRFESLTYLSSTRVYEGAATTDESTMLQVDPTNPGHLYNLSKLMGESLCHASGHNARVVRLSNVFGRAMPAQNFISRVFHEAASTGQVQFLTSSRSAKDYVSVNDVVRWLPQIAQHGIHSTYNVASGTNLSNAEIASLLEQKRIVVGFSEGAPDWSFPVIDNNRLVEEFGGAQSSLANEFEYLFDCFINHDNGIEDERIT
ncbi:MAG: NAD-dependent epimerase/dehydratase family protein [Ferrovum sp.]|jgi:nucleoside-diphosphate-sugar epimerase|uniref:NAD-dependent epimerase/dehydratase family protein n=1 Tax=Ferrovum sp. TaxID=2609467 RepID=UPI00260537DA|nr:NAD(P)-dependent oxidoreductase [Ferrovum sp.]MBW8066114.1 NAD-dependent epimerase/dehydratase family protein [Ferrovum sp.]